MGPGLRRDDEWWVGETPRNSHRFEFQTATASVLDRNSLNVVPALSRDPYVDGPRAARVFSRTDRIACIHMSGLLMRLVTAGQDGFPRREFQTRQRPLQANGSHGVSRTLDRSILPSALLQLRLDRYGDRRPADLSRSECRCVRRPRAIVMLSRRHQFPGDAGNLVGERYRGQLW